MEDGIYYSLEVNGNGQHNSLIYDTRKKADEAFGYLYDKFKENKILDKSKLNSYDEIVELSICQTIVGSIPNNLMAEFVPSELFKDVYEQMLIAAKEYYDKNK